MSFNPIKSAMHAASSGMNAQSFRMRVVSENLSNADTHGYQRKQISFKNELDRISGQNSVQIKNVTLDRSLGEQLYDPAHPLSDADGYVVMSNVDMMLELADAREAGRSYEANLSTFRQAAQMYSSLIGLLRR
ncbi:MAG: flagellar basal body rod protein FlgC [Acidimicrobiales bacterium]|nr:flagellar basal body rod protein FlgC [Hyphomonadaceae bacterium]RZV44765.1 MAG: flagellar basal body rod protein FlgC [Acidimicrobiales bacterium]